MLGYDRFTDMHACMDPASSHAQESQCERALAQAEKKLEESKQLKSLQGTQEVKTQRAGTMAKDVRYAQPGPGLEGD